MKSYFNTLNHKNHATSKLLCLKIYDIQLQRTIKDDKLKAIRCEWNGFIVDITVCPKNIC